MKKIKVTHIVAGLNIGGAETMLYKLLKYIDRDKFDISVISMMDDGFYGSKIRDLGFQVVPLNMKQGRPSVSGLFTAKKHLHDTDIIQTWLYHADLFGYILYKISKVKKLIWGIRRSNLDKDSIKGLTLMIAKINSKLSRNVDAVVSCSIKAKETHTRLGYFPENLIVIPNGFELNEFNTISYSREKLQEITGVKKNKPIIAHVGRWYYLKDHENFLKALKIVKQKKVDFHAVLVGKDITEDNYEIIDMLKKYDLTSNVTLLGRRNDIPLLMAGSDIFVSSSSGEGFPNVVGEAMACETPCVVTDVGDSAYIVGDTGSVVPSKNSLALSKGMIELLSLSKEARATLGSLARQRIIDKFDIYKVTNQFEDLYHL